MNQREHQIVIEKQLERIENFLGIEYNHNPLILPLANIINRLYYIDQALEIPPPRECFSTQDLSIDHVLENMYNYEFSKESQCYVKEKLETGKWTLNEEPPNQEEIAKEMKELKLDSYQISNLIMYIKSPDRDRILGYQ